MQVALLRERSLPFSNAQRSANLKISVIAACPVREVDARSIQN
jgi:hypothetical protein